VDLGCSMSGQCRYRFGGINCFELAILQKQWGCGGGGGIMPDHHISILYPAIPIPGKLLNVGGYFLTIKEGDFLN
jgi:hypothetical protein